MAATLQTVFNDQFMEFINDIYSIFPYDADIVTAKNALIAVRKANPKMIGKIWKTFIADKYRDQIEAGDLSFFLEKDYSADVAEVQRSDKIMESIHRLRGPIQSMSPENQAKTMKYIQLLTKLSDML
jgi:hypothetical protein